MNNECKKKERETMETEEERTKEVISALQQMEIDDIKCGARCCTPARFQIFAHTNVYLILYCVSGLVLGMFFTYHVSTISTIEKRFKLTSKETGIMLAGNDISQIMFAIIVAYFGNYGNRPKWLGIGIISASLACFLSVVPHLVYGPGQDAIDVAMIFSSSPSSDSNSSTLLESPGSLTTNNNDLCYSPYVADCEKDNSDLNASSLGALIILFLAEFCVGLAISTFYSLGIVYLDDNVNKKDSPMYYAISMIIRVVGPVAGYLLGSQCLALYIDPRYQPNISLRDPRWLGAWWLGFLLLGTMLMVCGSLLLLFPRTLPSTLYKQIRRLHQEESPDSKPLTKDSDLGYLLKLVKAKKRFTKPSLKELPAAIKRLFTNRIWVGVNFNTIFALLALMGYWNFKPKYLEYQFRKSASVANFYTGLASLIASILGLSISGLLIKVFRPGPRVISGYSCFLTIFSAIAMFSLTSIGCPKLDVVGRDLNSNSSCNDGCGCSDRYSPVCSSDNLTTFYSPCYAGCTAVDNTATPVEYLNCKCVYPSLINNVSTFDTTQSTDEIRSNPSIKEGKATQGYCPETCETFFYYVLITIITKTVDSTGRIGNTLIYLRAVEEHDKGLSLGVSVVLCSLFAFIPAPIMMGAIVDSACIIWDNTCGQRGNCWLYDSDKFRLIIHVVPGILLLVSLIGDLIVFVNSGNLILYDDDDAKERKSSEKSEAQLSLEKSEMKFLNSEMS